MNMTKETKAFGKALLETVASSDYTLADAAAKVGVEMDTFTNWCNGIALPSRDELHSFIEVFDIGRERVIYRSFYNEAVGSLMAQKALMNAHCYDSALHEWESENGSCGVYNGVFYAIEKDEFSHKVGIGGPIDKETYFAILSIVYRWAVVHVEESYLYLGKLCFYFFDTDNAFATAATIEGSYVGEFELDGETQAINAPPYWFNEVMAEARRARFGVEAEEESSVAIEWLDDSKSTGVFKGIYFEVKCDIKDRGDNFKRLCECHVSVTRLPSASDLVLFEHLLLTEKVVNWSSNSKVNVVFVTGLNRRPDKMAKNAMENTDDVVDTSVVVRHPVFLQDFLMRASDALGYEVGYDVDEADL